MSAVEICPTKAFIQRNHEAPIIDREKCIDCGTCSSFCPKQVLYRK